MKQITSTFLISSVGSKFFDSFIEALQFIGEALHVRRYFGGSRRTDHPVSELPQPFQMCLCPMIGCAIEPVVVA